jgi:predicted HicB family RNase H-like nuclease
MIGQSELKNRVEHYANLPYTVVIERRDDQGTYYVARVLELPDLLMTGVTPEEALAELESEKREWIEKYLELGNRMPVPLKSHSYSGKIILRMSPSMHESLTRMAELEGVSLNHYIVAALSRTLGYDESQQSRAASK